MAVEAIDDLQLAELRVTYRGSTQTRRFAAGTRSAEASFQLPDARGQRVSASEQETLRVEVFDDLGQSSHNLQFYESYEYHF